MIIFSGIALIVGAALVLRARKYSVRRALNMPKQSECGEKEAEECARIISMFLSDRAKAGGLYMHNMENQAGVTYEDLHRIMLGKDEGILALIRICRALGCELTIRQKPSDDAA